MSKSALALLVVELRNEHRILLRRLEEITVKGLMHSPVEREALLDLHDDFLAHQRKEDLRFYPKLKKVFKGNPVARHASYMLSLDQKSLEGLTRDFYKKHFSSGKGIVFVSELRAFGAKMRLHIAKEEKMLFSRFDMPAEETRLPITPPTLHPIQNT